jgi:hypothetical protein
MATLTAPSAVVTGAPRQPLPYGLFSAFSLRPEGDGRWLNGVRWEVGTCDPANSIGAPWCAPDPVEGLPKQLAPNNVPFGEASPITIYGHYACSAMSNSFSEAQRLATEHLINREEAAVEDALWNGDLGMVPNFSGANGYPAPMSAGAHDLEWHALAAVEQAIGEFYGSLGVIHMSRRTASLLLSKGSLESKGGRLYTELGTPVVAGAGYPDVGEIVGTPALFGYQGNVFDSSARPGDLMDRGSNDMVAVAERTYVIGFDPCGIVKATYSGELNNPPAGDPGTQSPLALTIGTIPASPIPDGTDTTITVQTNHEPDDEVYLWYRINGGSWTDNGEMTQVNPQEFVENVNGTLANAGDVVELYAKSGTTVSPTITVNIT